MRGAHPRGERSCRRPSPRMLPGRRLHGQSGAAASRGPRSVRKPARIPECGEYVEPLKPAWLHDRPASANYLRTPWRFKSSHPHRSSEQAFLFAHGFGGVRTMPKRITDEPYLESRACARWDGFMLNELTTFVQHTNDDGVEVGRENPVPTRTACATSRAGRRSDEPDEVLNPSRDSHAPARSGLGFARLPRWLFASWPAGSVENADELESGAAGGRGGQESGQARVGGQ